MSAVSSTQDQPWIAPRAWGWALGHLARPGRSATPRLDALLEDAAAEGSFLLAPAEEAGLLAVAGRDRLTLALPRIRSFDGTAAALRAQGVVVLRGLQGLASRPKPGGAAQPILIPISSHQRHGPLTLTQVWPDLVRTARPVRVLRLRKPWPGVLTAGLALPVGLEQHDAAFSPMVLPRLENSPAMNASVGRHLETALTAPVPPAESVRHPAVPSFARTYAVAADLLSWLMPLYLRRRTLRGKEDGTRLAERYGASVVSRPGGRLIWIHAASVGESLSVVPLVTALLEAGLLETVLVTTGTVTSAEIMRARLPEGAIHAFVPLDAPRFARRFLDHWRPDLAVFVESELWPNLQHALRSRNVPLAILNGRMSERSERRWQSSPRTIRWLLSGIDVILAQTPANATRFAALGATRVRHIGNLKFDAPAPTVASGDLSALDEAVRMRPIWLAASTHDGEDTLIGESHIAARDRYPNLLSIIVPRHPERGDAIVRDLGEMGLETARRTREQEILPQTDVYVADTMGELGLFYRVAPIAFIGGSLVPHGGHNPIEAAQLDSAILHGPHVANFADMYETFDACRGSVKVSSPAELTAQLIDLLADSGTRSAMTEAARSEIAHHAGALERALDALRRLLPAGCDAGS